MIVARDRIGTGAQVPRMHGAGHARVLGFTDFDKALPRRTWVEFLIASLPWLWLGGSATAFCLLGSGLIGVVRLRATSRELASGEIVTHSAVLARSLGVARRFTIAVCEQLSSPILIGVVRPVILLPPAALYGWSVEQVEMVLLHELAHLRRHDNFVNLMQCLLESVFFFHPAAWWLSAWVRLEREHCCDQLVVERTGRSQAYAEMLAELSGLFRGKSRVAVAMAERPVISRIRRILNMEDRLMRLTVPEGLGLIASAFVAGVLVLGARAAQPPAGEGEDATRLALSKAARDTAAIKWRGPRSDERGGALIAIAEAQVKLGDRAAALATMGLLDEWAATRVPKAGSAVGPVECSTLAVLISSAAVRRQAGDLAGDRELLAKIAKSIPAPDDPKLIAAFTRMADEQNKERDDDTRTEGTLDMLEIVAQLSVGLIEERIALGDMPEALALTRQAVAASRSMKRALKPMFAIALSPYLVKAGAPDEARELVAAAYREALALPSDGERDKIVPFIPQVLAKLGDYDGARKLATGLKAADREVAFRTYDRRVGNRG